jgi:hypothetical protein
MSSYPKKNPAGFLLRGSFAIRRHTKPNLAMPRHEGREVDARFTLAFRTLAVWTLVTT